MKNIFQRLLAPGKAEVDKFSAWAQKQAIDIDPLDGAGFNIERLSSFDELFTNKRIVYLGEEDHWIHEKIEYRILMLRYLFSRGWRHVGEEIGFSYGLRLDR